MKRFISIIIASLLSVAVLFAGCASSSPDGGGNGGGDHNGNNGSDTEQVEIVLGAEELTLEEGDSYTLSVQIDGTEEPARWASSAASVAAVSQDGKITAVSEGKAVITASVGDVSDSCTVTVEKAASVWNFFRQFDCFAEVRFLPFLQCQFGNGLPVRMIASTACKIAGILFRSSLSETSSSEFWMRLLTILILLTKSS